MHLHRPLHRAVGAGDLGYMNAPARPRPGNYGRPTHDPVLEWADLAEVLSEARKEVKKRGDPQRWQCCLTPELLELARCGLEDEVLDKLLSRLSGEDAWHMCAQIERCRSEGCSSRPLEQVPQ